MVCMHPMNQHSSRIRPSTPGSAGSNVRVILLVAAACLLAALLAGCDTQRSPDDPVPPPAAPQIEPISAPWTDEALKEVVELQVERDGEGLQTLLESEDSRIRARAALALASVQDPDAFEGLTVLLADPEPSVRLEAAFALGQISLPDGGSALLAALDEEDDPAVRLRLLEAIGKRVARGVGDRVMAFEPRDSTEDAHHRMALARMALGGVIPEGAVPHLVEGLSHSDPAIRKASAYLFGRSITPEGWSHERDRLREALDSLGRDDPAAIQLVRGIGQLRDWADRDRLLDWLREGRDWRIRVAAAQALGIRPLLDAEGVGDALATAMETDPSGHVAVAAATSLTGGADLSPALLDRARSWVREGPADRWSAQAPVVEYLAAIREVEPVMAWARRVGDTYPSAAMVALDLVALDGDESVTRFMEELADHRDGQVRGMALRMLGNRWRSATVNEEEMARIGRLLAERLAQGTPAEAVGAAQALRSRVYQGVVPDQVLLEAAHGRLDRRDSDPAPVVVEVLELLEVLTDQPAPETELPELERQVDWAALEALGPAPRLRLETEVGEAVFRLLPSQAPLTVQTLAELGATGAYRDVPFHRVVPGFVAQGGDFILGDGTGTPGFTIRSEFTRLPFQRGVLGMASSGKDTEDAQFFVTHGQAPHLDGNYTSFGWLESGADVVDGILAGHRILELEVLPGSGG